MNRVDYYQVLGVSRNATPEDLRHAFHCLMLAYHPDHNPGNQLAMDRTRGIIEAYKVLSNPGSRLEYDKSVGSPDPALRAGAIGYRKMPRTHYSATRAFSGLVAVLLIALATLSLMHLIDERSDAGVWRPQVVDLLRPETVTALPAVSEPAVLDSSEWYAAQEYQLTMANRWSTANALKAYSAAAARARIQGDRAAESFYRLCMRQIVNGTPLYTNPAAFTQ